MSINYARVIKPGHANDWNAIAQVSNQVRRVIAGIANSDPTSEAFMDEVKIQMQPRPDGALAVLGWIERDPVEGIPDEDYDPEIEIIPDNTRRDPQEVDSTILSNDRNPFQR